MERRNRMRRVCATGTVAKILRFGRTRTQIGVDIFNLMNSNVAQGYLQTFGATWLRPTSVMDARFARVSGQIEF